MAKNTTRKRGRTEKGNKMKSKSMTIPQLRKAFESVNVETKKLLDKHPINAETISAFQKVWKKIFGKVIDTSTAESYLRLQGKVQGKLRRKTYKKGKAQKGGMAPIDYMLRPGLDGSQGTIQGVYGSFLPYLSSELSVHGNLTNNIAMDSDCGKVDISPTIGFDMGSNKVGGGFSDILHGRAIASSVPSSILQDAQDVYLGRPLGASPNVVQTTYTGK